MKDEHVFPQTPAEDENFNRTGGLTKRELFAAMFMAASYDEGFVPLWAVMKADELLEALEKKT
jgi:hypothetical protein